MVKVTLNTEQTNNVVFADETEELRYKFVLVELFGAGCLPLFTAILQVRSSVSVSV